MPNSKTYYRRRQNLPGPTEVWSQGKNPSLRPSTYHRSEEFRKTLLAVREKLAPFFGTKTKPIIFSSSGSGAMESAVVNLTDPGDSVLIIEGGKFGERWIDLCKVYGCDVHVLKMPWGRPCDLNQVEAVLKKISNLKVCFFQGVETSTGLKLPVKELTQLIKTYSKALVVVDAITTLCSEPNQMDDWSVDCMVGGSQKGFGVSAGLSFLALSDYARQNLSKRPRFYFDFALEFSVQEKGYTAWSSAVELVEDLNFSLDRIHEQGLESFVTQQHRVAQSVREAIQAMGCELFTQEAFAASVTAFCPPEGLDAEALLKKLFADYEVEFSGGQAELKGKILRIGHLGFVDPLDIVSSLTALEYALKDLGSTHILGAGVSKFMKVFRDLTRQEK